MAECLSTPVVKIHKLLPTQELKLHGNDAKIKATNSLSLLQILREIFQHFSTTQLIQLSLVNKLWNHESRNLMGYRGDLTARINKNRTCQDLRAFASDLRQMTDIKKVVPFSGMTIALEGHHWTHGSWCNESSAGELDQVYEDILDKMTWKHLIVSFNNNWDACRNCPAFVIVSTVLQKYCCMLEELSLNIENKQEFVEEVLQDCSFLSLKGFRLQKGNSPRMSGNIRQDDTILIKTVVRTAPNLQVLYTEDRVDLSAKLLEGSSAVHVTEYKYSPCLDEIPESVAGELRMQRMRIMSIHPQFNLERFNKITQRLLKNSHKTLRSLEVAAIFLVPITQYGICLRNLKNLSVNFTTEGVGVSQPSLSRLLRSFNFTRVFPNLTSVDISWIRCPDYEPLLSALTDMVQNAHYSGPAPDRAVNIKSLNLQWCGSIPDPSIKFLVNMFPDVQRLSIRAEEIPFARIWDAWLELKELDVTLGGIVIQKNFDGAFCGLFPEEVAQLQEEDEEYLRRVNIVPVRPSITCLKGLTTLKIAFGDFHSFNGREDDPMFLFSKVTGLIAFRRSPSLCVTLAMDDERVERALSHLKPYASFVGQEPGMGVNTDEDDSP